MLDWIPSIQPVEVSGTCWKIIAAMASAVVAMAAYVVRLHKVYGRKINDVYDARVSDLKENHALVETLLRVVGKEKGSR